MGEKLKTLKDFYFNDENGEFYSSDLKKEAIRWLKHINKDDGGMCHTCDELWNRFFNITEDDLNV